jgi:thioesterase domain-containing protein
MPDIAALTTNQGIPIDLEPISYPGWPHYARRDFSADVLIDELVERIVVRVPIGPIRIIGMSIGGHFGYAAALRLQSKGRDISGFCAIDSFMISSAEPSAGWQTRAVAQVFDLIRKRRVLELMQFARSRFWRALFRLAGNRMPGLLRAATHNGRLPAFSTIDPLFEPELNMRLLIRATAPWIASLDRDPIPLLSPAVLLRTRLTAGDDTAWRSRCPNIEIREIEGGHQTLFNPENVASLRAAFAMATRNWR